MQSLIARCASVTHRHHQPVIFLTYTFYCTIHTYSFSYRFCFPALQALRLYSLHPLLRRRYRTIHYQPLTSRCVVMATKRRRPTTTTIITITKATTQTITKPTAEYRRRPSPIQATSLAFPSLPPPLLLISLPFLPLLLRLLLRPLPLLLLPCPPLRCIPPSPSATY